MRRFAVRAIQIVALLAIATLVWAGWYASNKGFTRKWREEISREFRKRGVEVSIKRLTLDPFEGLVARDVRIVDKKDSNKFHAVISRIVLDINYANLLQREPFLNAITLRDANLTLPINPSNPDTARVTISKFN